MSEKHIHIEWSGEGRHFTGHDPSGPVVQLDGNSKAGSSPMTMLLHAHAACAGIDVVDILQKMRQRIDSFKVEVDAVRAEGDYPRVWEKIHLRFILAGDIAPEKAQKAVSLSTEKYCSVSAMLEKVAEITTEVVVE